MPLDPDLVHPASPVLPAWLDHHRYAGLRTFRADGRGVDTPIWFAVDVDGTILVRTPTATAKVRRLRADARAELRPCDWRGRPVGDDVLAVTGSVLPRAEAVAAEPVLRRRYGWQWNVVPVVPVPGVPSAHRGASLRARWRLARATELWEGSSLLRLVPVS